MAILNPDELAISEIIGAAPSGAELAEQRLASSPEPARRSPMPRRASWSCQGLAKRPLSPYEKRGSVATACAE
jgi:hypothetical protein